MKESILVREMQDSGIVSEGVSHALSKIRENFEFDFKSVKNLPYHNTEHTINVIRRANLILNTIHKFDPTLVTKRDISVGILAAAFHDIVQNWTIVDGKRKRTPGESEALSAEKLEKFMREMNVFSEEDIFNGKNAILATIPSFDLDLGTVYQPHLTKDSTPISLAVALSDINTAGIDGPSQFLDEGDRVLREENPNLLESIYSDTASENEQTEIKAKLIGGAAFQINFAQGRKKLFEKEIDHLPKELKEIMSDLFDKFDLSISEAKRAVEKRKSMSYATLLKDFGY